MARPSLISGLINRAWRRCFSGSGTSHFSWIMLLLLLAITMCAAGLAKIVEQNLRVDALAAQRQQLDAAIKDRLDHDAQILRAAAAMLMLQRTMGRTDWLQFHKNLAAQGLPDGMLQLGYAPLISTAQKGALLASMRENTLSDHQITPTSDHPVHAPILFIAPEKNSGHSSDHINDSASVSGIGGAGFDLLSVPKVSTLLAQATDSGAISFGSLVTDQGPSRSMMVLPVFSENGAVSDVTLRRQQVIGFVFAVLRTDTVLHGIEVAQYRNTRLLAAADSLQKYDGPIGTHSSITPEQNMSMDIDLYGTQWRVGLFLPPFPQQKMNNVTGIAIGGVLLDFLLFAMLRRFDALHRINRSGTDSAKSAIKRLQNHLSVITAHTDHAVIMVDRQFRIISFNPAAEILFCASAAQAVGTDLTRFLPNRLRGAKRWSGTSQRGGQAAEYRLHNDVDTRACRTNGEQFLFDARIVKSWQLGHQGYLILLKELSNTPQELPSPEKILEHDALMGSDRQEPAAQPIDALLAVNDTCAAITTHTVPLSYLKPLPASNCERRKQGPGKEHEIGGLYRQLQSRMRTLESAREEQQKRLAREMHDDFGQLLSAMKMDLVAMQMQLATANSPLAAQLGDVSELVDAMIVSVRRIIANLPPQHINEHGLVFALKQLTSAHARRHKVACRLQIPPELRLLDTALVTPVYRIIQEALNNIAKHARATEIDVCIEQNDNRLFLRVTDNGNGISTYELQKPGGFGLIGMRERIITLNGEMALETASGIGTTIRATIPLNDEMADRVAV